MQNKLYPFMQNHFDGLVLRPSLFYSSKYGLRFEISIPGVNHLNKRNLKQIKDRTTRLFDQVFKDSDDILLITDVHTMKDDRFLENRPTKVYQKYVRRKDTRYKLFYELFHIKEEDENMVTHRFILPCQKHDIRYQPLLMAISCEDFPHPTQLLKGSQHAGIDIYFVNVTRKMIFHLYDDRGCDIIASDKEDLRSLYRECNNWILDYDRVQIDDMMNNQ
ncbi:MULTISPECIES: DUF3885 domain-containing protein [Rossellomorea]|jgi:Domain of unknown function (DUF3885)|uniref:DUF3885 domain-containing protein n=1 Tax=Rossellomorea TaxID=2837508 RepID=UPI0011E96428|nr:MULTISPECIES: DUF3885 domain-containing protein [Rossellomorea]MDT9025838.1 DUF3885 domain-containing protein [Rossellomorea sp. YC4-1]TYS90115.1 DUF3885 domain-containing protein [Rossellomorea aquimaris]